jgi:hypothetical protein
MSDDRGPYRVYHLNRHVRTFNDRDEAALWVNCQRTPGDYEILDRSDS